MNLPRNDKIMYRFIGSVCSLITIASSTVRTPSNISEEGICERTTFDVNLPLIGRARTFEELLILGNAFVDKSLLVKEILERPEKVFVITAPQAWGKSMNLDMLRLFVEMEGDSSGKLLKPTETTAYKYFHFGHVPITSTIGKPLKFKSPPIISKYPKFLEQHLGKYPVIHLKLRIDEYPSYVEVLAMIKMKISEEFTRFKFATKSTLEEAEKFDRIASNSENDVAQIKQSLKLLCKVLHQSFAKRVIILIDNYDSALNFILEPWRFVNITRVIKKKVINLYAALFLQTFNDNEYLEKAVLMGNMMGCPELLFSKLNNIALFDVMTNQLNRFFGFTRREVDLLFELAEMPADLAKQAHEWYYGYNMNKDAVPELIVYNPWDIAIFIDKEKIFNWWENSASDDSIRMLLKFPEMYYLNLHLASRKNSSVSFENTHISEKDCDHIDELVHRNFSITLNNDDVDVILKRLCSAGYLTFARYFVNYVGNVNATQVKIPNTAIQTEYHRIVPKIRKDENDTEVRLAL